MTEHKRDGAFILQKVKSKQKKKKQFLAPNSPFHKLPFLPLLPVCHVRMWSSLYNYYLAYSYLGKLKFDSALTTNRKVNTYAERERERETESEAPGAGRSAAAIGDP